jgi:putative thiamine transport system substrate-binding protein
MRVLLATVEDSTAAVMKRQCEALVAALQHALLQCTHSAMNTRERESLALETRTTDFLHQGLCCGCRVLAAGAADQRGLFMFIRLSVWLLAASLSLAGLSARAAAPDPQNWEALLAEARGQTVYFHAWGGEPRINAYLDWAADTVKERFGVAIVHVKVSDTAEVVSRVLTEKVAGRETGGAVDLVWINGENFAAMKREGLLLPDAWATKLPNYRYVDVENKPTVANDFTIPVDGQESPWGMAKLVFFHDPARLSDPPASAAALGEWIAQNPGRFTYPQPPDFLGVTFLKQLLVELTPEPALLQQPATDAAFAAATEPLFAWLDAAKPNLWRQGRAYPANTADLRRLLADGEVEISFAFNPADASSAIADGELPDTVRSFVFPTGTLGNTHFVAIPFNANAAAGAMVLADFLLSPEAQARKEDPTSGAIRRFWRWPS